MRTTKEVLAEIRKQVGKVLAADEMSCNPALADLARVEWNTACDRLRACAGPYVMESLIKHIDELQAKLDAAAVDAERYRTMRNADMDARNFLEHHAFYSLDAAIDAMRTGEPKV